MERAGAEELELSSELMWDPDEEDPQYENVPADNSAVSRSTRSQRPELLQGIP